MKLSLGLETAPLSDLGRALWHSASMKAIAYVKPSVILRIRAIDQPYGVSPSPEGASNNKMKRFFWQVFCARKIRAPARKRNELSLASNVFA